MMPDTLSETRRVMAAKKRLTIVIIDSGMGGLSICAGMVEGLQKHPIVEHVGITYFNAWPEQNRGYNSLPDMTERLRVFDRALLGMQEFRPDIVYIACNTLSILYPQTEFSQRAKIPVIGIIDFGVELILAHLGRDAHSQVVIMGTLTTISSETHKKALMERGIEERRIITQDCDQLATEIEKDPDSPNVRAMIDACVREAAVKLPDPKAQVFVALCCTHYGFAGAGFRQSLETRIGPAASILNPNDLMSTHLFENFRGQPPHTAEIDLTVVSRIMWSDQKVTAIARALHCVSPATAQALINYRHDPGLFSF